MTINDLLCQASPARRLSGLAVYKLLEIDETLLTAWRTVWLIWQPPPVPGAVRVA
jgi:hypothetical protein